MVAYFWRHPVYERLSETKLNRLYGVDRQLYNVLLMLLVTKQLLDMACEV